MIVSHKFNFVFVKTTKTAGTSIEVYLSQFCGASDIVTPIYPAETGHTPRNYGEPEIANPSSVSQEQFLRRKSSHKFQNHFPGSKIRELLGNKTWGNYRTFCVERNPWDKAVSYYNMQVFRNKTKDSFERYCLERKFPSDLRKWFDVNHNKISVDKVIRYENLNVELGEIFKELGIPFENGLNVFAKSEYRVSRRPYQSYYTRDEMIEVVAQKCGKEIELLGYKFEG